MTQAIELTAEELAKLAEIAGLRLCCYSDGREYWGLDIQPICAKDAFHPDRNWEHLGMVIKGMAARGLLLQTFPYTDDGRAMYQARFRPPEYTPSSKPWEEAPPEQVALAICRAALTATKE